MAAAGVNYTVGRESASAFGEAAAGRLPVSLPGPWACGCDWSAGAVDGRGAGGKPLPLIQAAAASLPPAGGADKKVQAYNFRLCMTQSARNFRPIPPPSRYDPTQWELLRRVLKSGGDWHFSSFIGCSDLQLGDNKTDCNNRGGLSTDMIGGSWTWPEATHEERLRLFLAHKDYTLGLFHFLRTDSASPPALQEEVRRWGLCADEFVDSGGWPHQLYVREARRMVSDFVFTQHDRVTNVTKTDAIALGAYNLDAHMAERVLLPNGSVTNEGCLSGWAASQHVRLPRFQIPYRVLLPPQRTAGNLLVTCAVSGTHVGSASLRLEPQYMGMGHAAGVAAAMVVQGAASSVQEVPIARLQQLLIQQGVDEGISPASGGGAGGFVCGLDRCIASPGGRHRNASCSGECVALAHDEWIGSAGAWSFAGSVATATRATHLKKSTVSSGVLNRSMVHAVPQGGTCELSVDGRAEWQQYFACSLKPR